MSDDFDHTSCIPPTTQQVHDDIIGRPTFLSPSSRIDLEAPYKSPFAPIDFQSGSKHASEKRSRNANASKRFRTRRKQQLEQAIKDKRAAELKLGQCEELLQKTGWEVVEAKKTVEVLQSKLSQQLRTRWVPRSQTIAEALSRSQSVKRVIAAEADTAHNAISTPKTEQDSTKTIQDNGSPKRETRHTMPAVILPVRGHQLTAGLTLPGFRQVFGNL